jgi:hypothetical protein
MKLIKGKAASSPGKSGGSGRGSLTPAEMRPLILAAMEAYRCQDPEIAFNDWRHEQVMEAVGLPGFSACHSAHFCDLMGHFKTLAGREDQAVYWYSRAKGNSARQLAWAIMNRLAKHQWLATASAEDLARLTTPRRIPALRARQSALIDHPEGPIGPDYLRKIIRDSLGRPALLIDDLAAYLTRLEVANLVQIRNTLVNRISEREGVGFTADRNKSQRGHKSAPMDWICR